MPPSRRMVRTSRPRRKLVWARQANSGASIAAGAGETFGADILAPFRTQVGATLPGLTVVRIRLEWMIVDTTAQSRLVLAGIRPWTSSEPVTDVAGPATDPHADWMAFDAFGLQTAVGDSEQGLRQVDVKSMRKLEEVQQQLALVFEAVDELAAQIRYVVSVLVALP